MSPRVVLRRVAALIAIFTAMLCGTPAIAQTRVALIIGNSAYRSVPALPNPAHDAADVASAFGRLGFSVRQVTDATYDDIRRALLEFSEKARNAEMAVVFFAGHGMEVGGENWLIPIDAELKADVNTEQEAIALRGVVLTVSAASKLGLVMLDACRNNPFLAKMSRTVLTRSVDRGLARIEPTSSVLVAYAAKDGTTAADGGGRHSPFTTALLEHVETPGLEINFLFRNIRDEVVAATQGAQQPFVYGSLSKEAIYLKSPAATSLPGPDEVAWGFLKETIDSTALARFAQQYPDSLLRPQAEARIAVLTAAQQAERPVPPSPDEVTWAIPKDTRDQAALARFVARYPNSAFRPQAEAQMAALESNSAGKPGLARTSVSSPTSADFYTFTSALASAGTPWCVDVPGSEYRPGRPLSLFGCAGTPNQIFGFGNRSNLTSGGLCLAGGSRNRNRAPGAGDPVVLAECDGSDHQVWELEPFDDNPSLISLVAPSGLCVTVDGANPAPRAPLMLAQCDQQQSQGWIAADMARPARAHPQEGSANVARSGAGYAQFPEPEYYWFEGHRYCWYDEGWRGPGWYWCSYNVNKGIGWGGPIGWHFWFHFRHRVLNHPVLFAAHHGKPAHQHMAEGAGKIGEGSKSGEVGKKGQDSQSGKGKQPDKGYKGGQDEKTRRAGKDNKGSQGAGQGVKKEAQNHKLGNQGNHIGITKETIAVKNNQSGPKPNNGNHAGGGGGGGHHGSDIRLKQDIVPLARLDNGIGLYRFRYKGINRTVYVGVLAQEVEKIMPSAVSRGSSGYLEVDYDRLGLNFMSWKAWLRCNSPELHAGRTEPDTRSLPACLNWGLSSVRGTLGGIDQGRVPFLQDGE